MQALFRPYTPRKDHLIDMKSMKRLTLIALVLLTASVSSMQAQKKRMVVEEGTGITCGFCPQGIVGLETMYETYPGQFIGIAIHSFNLRVGPECPEEYQPFATTYFDSYPTCRIQRRYTDTPRFGRLESRSLTVMNETPKLTAEVSSALSADGQSIEAICTTTATMSNPGEHRIAFVLTEDNVTGYKQTNNYAGGGYGAMGGFENMDVHAEIDLMHVARATYDLYGAEGSLPTELQKGDVVEYKRTLSIPTTVQNTANLNVIALLINAATGEIENGAEARVDQSSGSTAIGSPTYSLTASPQVRATGGQIVADGYRITGIFTPSGVAVANQSLPHGIYIVQLTDGKKMYTRRLFL